MKWDSFTQIQDKTIPIILNTNKDVVISSGTASGKTEAALLPIVSLIEKKASLTLKVLYVSPLKALINNQFGRIEKLCEYTDIPIHRWHGDINQSQKKKFINQPAGILQITPESIESLFINRTGQLLQIFQHLEFIVIDEIHSFIGSERGVHLRSLLSRIQSYTLNAPRIIGLSATIDNFELVKRWINFSNPKTVEVIEALDSDKKLLYHLMHIPTDEDKRIPVEFFEDIRELTRDQKAIIFCNSRGNVEETTVFLNRLAEREKMGETYYAHHSSIDKKEREFVEKTIMESKLPKSVVATSSLELGIDIGDIDVVIQLDSTFTVSSLKQRLGRSGRKKDANQMLQLYSTKEDSLLQSLAVMELVLEKWIEPSANYPFPIDIAFHQIISICQETNGVSYSELIDRIGSNHILYTIDSVSLQALISHMIEQDHLEVVREKDELIVGIEGERILRSKEFYSVFITPEEYEVLSGIRRIGKLDKSPFISAGDNIILAGKLWTILGVDADKNKVYVNSAVNGKPPLYVGSGGKLHKKIGKKMWEIAISDREFSYTNEEATNTLNSMRAKYQHYGFLSNQRPVWVDKEEMLIETFTGTTIAQTLGWMLRAFGVNVIGIDGIGRIRIKGTPEINTILSKIRQKDWQPEALLPHTKENEYYSSKYSIYLPKSLQDKIHMAHEIDLISTLDYLNQNNFRHINLT
ncbi:DEAD/DEAH box helicase [Sporosarcina luteola]|uniref:DEAD/DEAH box helicase n=1 Tax=Sporosarcina luteola TaxID=582850 RepID=UPI00203D8CD7|nr:DEAD/DEAH box helicase [Sporosarcina luteola]MCM3638885.1 DEAD/DEAH box helicase [Sporosarcina luteola]